MYKKSSFIVIFLLCAVLCVFAEGDLRVVEIPGITGWGSISADGKTLVIARGKNYDSLVLYDIGSGKQKIVLKGRDVHYPRLDPSGRKIIFSSEKSNAGLWIIGTDGKNLQPFPSKQGLNSYERNPIWSPDGAKVAWARDSELWIANADGSGAKALVRNLNDGKAVIGWPMDWIDNKIVTLGNTSEGSLSAIRVVDASTGKVTETMLRADWAQFCESSEYLLYCPEGDSSFHFWSVTNKAEADNTSPLKMDTDKKFYYPEFTRTANSTTLFLSETDYNGDYPFCMFLITIKGAE